MSGLEPMAHKSFGSLEVGSGAELEKSNSLLPGVRHHLGNVYSLFLPAYRRCILKNPTVTRKLRS
jgi:hypothetical protein